MRVWIFLGLGNGLGFLPLARSLSALLFRRRVTRAQCFAAHALLTVRSPMVGFCFVLGAVCGDRRWLPIFGHDLGSLFGVLNFTRQLVFDVLLPSSRRMRRFVEIFCSM